MKKILWAFLFVFSINSYALEIQCKTDFDSVDAVIKTSQDSGVTYLLLMSGDSVTPIPLTSGNISIDTDSITYSDSQLGISLNRLEFKGDLVFEDGTKVKLQDCKEY